MAAAAQGQDTVRITINDTEIEVPKGELIVESVKRLGLEIPIFCYHPRMEPVGMCRMCLVEVGFKQEDGSVRKMPKPQAGCTLPASEGMVVYTDTEMVHNDRRGVLEFLLINHPLDCPVCDRGGECPLQNNTIFYGPSTSRFIELKRHLPKAFPLSDYVTLDLERCIQCGRCVRFTEEISGDHQLAFRFRGAAMQPSTFQLTDFTSKFSGNTIEICPVGALTSAKYRFRARPWDIETAPGICTVSPTGAAVWFDHRAGKFVRIRGRTNEAVNEEWLSDSSMFGHDYYNDPKRLLEPAMREDDGFRKVSWSEAYNAVLEAFSGPERVAGLVKPDFSNEGLYLFQKMFRVAFGSNNIDHRWTRKLLSADERPLDHVQDLVADLENKKSVLVFGTSLADEVFTAFLRIRKAWLKNGCRVVAVTPGETEEDRFAEVSIRYPQGSEAAISNDLLGAARGDSRGDAGIKAAIDALRSGPCSIVCTRRLLDAPDGLQTIRNLEALAKELGANFNLYVLDANEQGAQELGVLPDVLPGNSERGKFEEIWGSDLPNATGRNTQAILEGCANGEIEALWLVGADPIRDWHDNGLARKALESVPFLVYTGTAESEAAHYASLILPMAAQAEGDGSYTNVERRVQRMKQLIADPGDSKPAWRIFSECLLRAKPQTPPFNPAEVMDEIARAVPHFEAARFEYLTGEGIVLPPAKEKVEVSS